MDKEIVFLLEKYLCENNIYDSANIDNEVEKRKAGKTYSLSDHVRGLVFSQLSGNGGWKRIVKHENDIIKLFADFDIAFIESKESSYFINGLLGLKCGSLSTRAQMNALHTNISIMKQIENEYGSMDRFVMSQPAPAIISLFCGNNSPYRLKEIGVALAWEYLRNVGIDGAKPDRHLMRIMGSNRLGVSNKEWATEKEVYDEIERLSMETGRSRYVLDALFWSYCADGYAEICGANPKCNECIVSGYCNYKGPGQKEKTENTTAGKKEASKKKSVYSGVKTYSENQLDMKYELAASYMEGRGIALRTQMPDHKKNHYRILVGGSSFFVLENGYRLYCTDDDSDRICAALGIHAEPNYKVKREQILDPVRPNTINISTNEDFEKVVECLLLNYKNR